MYKVFKANISKWTSANPTNWGWDYVIIGQHVDKEKFEMVCYDKESVIISHWCLEKQEVILDELLSGRYDLIGVNDHIEMAEFRIYNCHYTERDYSKESSRDYSKESSESDDS